MAIPSTEEQIQFLLQLQRLLTEGQFTATYKYALLIALAEIAVEVDGGDLGGPLIVNTRQIAEKFVDRYWRQVIPYMAGRQSGGLFVLRQNTGGDAIIVGLVGDARKKY